MTVVTEKGTHLSAATNHVNFDTAGYIGKTEVVTLVTEMADYSSGCPTDVAGKVGGIVTTTVDYGNVESTRDENNKFRMVYIINFAFPTPTEGEKSKALVHGGDANSWEDGCSLDAVFITP